MLLCELVGGGDVLTHNSLSWDAGASRRGKRLQRPFLERGSYVSPQPRAQEDGAQRSAARSPPAAPGLARAAPAHGAS